MIARIRSLFQRMFTNTFIDLDMKVTLDSEGDQPFGGQADAVGAGTVIWVHPVVNNRLVRGVLGEARLTLWHENGAGPGNDVLLAELTPELEYVDRGESKTLPPQQCRVPYVPEFNSWRIDLRFENGAMLRAPSATQRYFAVGGVSLSDSEVELESITPPLAA